MGLESPSFISDFISTNPEGTDARSQGDDHIRNMKSALKATFPSASRAFFFPTATTKSAHLSVTSTDQNKTFYIDASGQTTSLLISLPTNLTASDAGWQCTFCKGDFSSTPLIITASSASLNSGSQFSMSSLRRGISGVPFIAFWMGSVWLVTRCVQLPLGAVIDSPTPFLPIGFEWANGQILSSSALYPEFFAFTGTLLLQDRRGRAAFGKDDMGGAAAGRITTASSGVDGTSLNAAGGGQTVLLTASNIPQISGSTTSTVTPPTVSHFARGITTSTGSVNVITDATNATLATQSQSLFVTASDYSHTHTVTVGAASPTRFAILPPMMISNHVIVVE